MNTPQQQQTPEQVQQYQQQMQQYQQQMQQYQQQMQQQAGGPQAGVPYMQPQTALPQQGAIPQQYPGYPPQYPQYIQQPPTYPQYAPQYQNRGGFQQNSGQAHSDRVLWVGNLHQEVNENELREIFQQFGQVENIKLVHTKACAFITFNDPQAATRAHTDMNHQQIHNQEIKVGWGKAEGAQGGGFQQNPYGVNPGGNTTRLPDINKELPQMAASRALWIGNVTNQITEPLLREMFSRYGNIESIRTMIQKNCAFITYTTVEEATNAKNSMDKFRVADTFLRVNFGKA